MLINTGHTTNLFNTSAEIHLKVVILMDKYTQLTQRSPLLGLTPRCRFMTDVFELVSIESKKFFVS